MKTANKVTADVGAIADGMLVMAEFLPECYQSAMKLGLLPAPLMEMLEKYLREEPGIEESDVKEIMKSVSLAMLERIDLVV